MNPDEREWHRRWSSRMTLDQFRSWLCVKTDKGWKPLNFPETMYPRYLRR